MPRPHRPVTDAAPRMRGAAGALLAAVVGLLLASCSAAGATGAPQTPAAQLTASTVPATGTSTSTAAAPSATPGSGPAGCTLSADYLGQSMVPDEQTLAPGAAFTQTWAVRNGGTCTWGGGYALVFVGGDQLDGPPDVVVPTTAPGEIANLSAQLAAPPQPGTYSGTWELQANNGAAFGQLTVTINVAAPPTAAPGATSIPPTPAPSTPVPPTPPPSPTAVACTPSAEFVADVTIPSGAAVAPGEPFIKTWRVRNTGTCRWDGGYALIFIEGDPMGAPPDAAVPLTRPGALADISLSLIAPEQQGAAFATWELQDGQGDRLLDLELSITVEGSDAQATSSPTPTVTPIDAPVPESVPPTPTMTPAASATASS